MLEQKIAGPSTLPVLQCPPLFPALLLFFVSALPYQGQPRAEDALSSASATFFNGSCIQDSQVDRRSWEGHTEIPTGESTH